MSSTTISTTTTVSNLNNTDVYIDNNGWLDLTGNANNSQTFTLAGGTMEIGGVFNNAEFDFVPSDTLTSELFLDSPPNKGTISNLIGGFNGTYDGLGLLDSTLAVTTLTDTLVIGTLGANTLNIYNGTTEIFSLTDFQSALTPSVTYENGYVFLGTGPVPCFAEGTRILTTRGEVPVEALQVGDVAITSRDGAVATRPIIWIGHRSISLDRHPDREKVEPVRIRAGAFGDLLPARDVVVSPDHAVYANGALIEAKNLVNGVTITRDTKARRVTYYHVELDAHDILLAEGLPTESYIDDGNRNMFANSEGPVALHADFATSADAPRCAPLMHEGEAVDAVRSGLRDRALALGFGQTNALDAVLVAGGVTIAPMADEAGVLRFALPDHAGNVELRVNTGVPAETGISAGDRRVIGIKLAGASVVTASGRHEVDLDTVSGLSTAEPDGRWTGAVASFNLTDTGAARVLELRYVAIATRWVARAERLAAIA